MLWTRFDNPTSDGNFRIVAFTDVLEAQQQAAIKEYLTSKAFQTALGGTVPARTPPGHESGSEASDVHERSKRQRKQPEIFKFPSPVKKSKVAPVTPASSRKSGSTPASSRKTRHAKAPKQDKTKRNRKLVLETDQEEGEEGDSEYEEDEEDEEDEEGVEGDDESDQTSQSTGGIRPKGFTNNKSVITQPPKQTPQNRSQRPPVVHGTRGRTNLKGGDPSQASTPNTSSRTGQTPPPSVDQAGIMTPAGMSFEVLPFILF